MKLKLRMLAALAGVPVLVAAPLIGCSCSKKETVSEAAQKIIDAIKGITSLTPATADQPTVRTSFETTANTAIASVKGDHTVTYTYGAFTVDSTDPKKGTIEVSVEIKLADSIAGSIDKQVVAFSAAAAA